MVQQPGGNIIVDNFCPYCKKNYLMTKRSFANHMKYCDENPKVKENLQIYGKKISSIITHKGKTTLQSNLNSKRGEIKTFEVTCEHCSKLFTVKEREFEFPKKLHYFCSRSCANSRKHSESSKRKISNGLRNHYGDIKYTCEICGKTFKSSYPKKWCSIECRRIFKYNEKISNNNFSAIQLEKMHYKLYWLQCQFKFALNDFPDEFDFELIKKYGWYKAKNKGNNLNGVTRDHVFSIKTAYQNKIDPYYISHPANCSLVLQKDNISKYTKCGYSIEELYSRVEEWNKKYGKYPNTINYVGLDL